VEDFLVENYPSVRKKRRRMFRHACVRRCREQKRWEGEGKGWRKEERPPFCKRRGVGSGRYQGTVWIAGRGQSLSYPSPSKSLFKSRCIAQKVLEKEEAGEKTLVSERWNALQVMPPCRTSPHTYVVSQRERKKKKKRGGGGKRREYEEKEGLRNWKMRKKKIKTGKMEGIINEQRGSASSAIEETEHAPLYAGTRMGRGLRSRKRKERRRTSTKDSP